MFFRNKNFYELEINSQDILFEGDLNYYTQAINHLEDDKLCTEKVKCFISGENGLELPPRIEILVRKAIVADILMCSSSN